MTGHDAFLLRVLRMMRALPRRRPWHRRMLAAMGLGVLVFGWVALADALECRYIFNPATRTWTRVCR